MSSGRVSKACQYRKIGRLCIMGSGDSIMQKWAGTMGSLLEAEQGHLAWVTCISCRLDEERDGLLSLLPSLLPYTPLCSERFS